MSNSKRPPGASGKSSHGQPRKRKGPVAEGAGASLKQGTCALCGGTTPARWDFAIDGKLVCEGCFDRLSPHVAKARAEALVETKPERAKINIYNR